MSGCLNNLADNQIQDAGPSKITWLKTPRKL